MEDEIQFFRRTRQGAAYAEIVLNRPTKGNAITHAMLDLLEAIVRSIAADREIRAVVLRGNGKFFCTGGDIREWSALTPERMARDWILRGIGVLESIAALPQPVIAAIHGPAFGGGVELALAADLRIAVRAATFGTPEVGLGMIAGWGGVRRLAETIGVGRARHLVLLGQPIGADEALAWGLVTALALDVAALEIALDAWLDRLLANAPIAMALSKELLASAHRDMRHEHAQAAARAIATADCAEGVRAFAEKRRPVFTGR